MRILFFLSVAMLASCNSGSSIKNSPVTQLLDQYLEENLKLFPFWAPYYGFQNMNEQSDDDGLSDESIQKQHDLRTRTLEKAKQIERKNLQADELDTLDSFIYDLETALEGEKFPKYLLPIDQMWSRIMAVVSIAGGDRWQPFETVKDYDNWIKKVSAQQIWAELAIQRMKEGVKKGVTLPRVAAAKIPKQLRGLIVNNPEKSVFWGPIPRFPKSFSDADKKRLEADFRKVISGILEPMLEKLATFIEKDYVPHCRTTTGFGSLPKGEAWYNFEILNQTTTRATARQIHQLGLDEVARIHSEIHKIRTELGFKGDLKKFLDWIRKDPQNNFKTEAEALQAFKDFRAKVDAVLPKFFGLKPKTDYEIRSIEDYRAATAASGEYQPGSEDGKMPGIFYVNTKDLKRNPIYGMETLSLHEAAPGHHFQIMIQMEMSDRMPKYRRYQGYNAYVEGWALYAESLGKEMGFYTDPMQYYGHLGDALLRAMRLVVDTGLHDLGWSREKTIQYMLDNSSMSEGDVVSEVERYMVWPGQALSYKMGQFKIRELRERSEKTLGSAFDIRKFHDLVLSGGALPLSILERKVDAWLQSSRKK